MGVSLSIVSNLKEPRDPLKEPRRLLEELENQTRLCSLIVNSPLKQMISVHGTWFGIEGLIVSKATKFNVNFL